MGLHRLLVSYKVPRVIAAGDMYGVMYVTGWFMHTLGQFMITVCTLCVRA